jgi:hypothetical protein
MKGITRTELVWVGKYDEEGNLCPVERNILPFQVVETINESKTDREKVQRDLWTLMPATIIGAICSSEATTRW